MRPANARATSNYESGSAYRNTQAILLLSLESLPNGQPPYGIINTYTW